MHQTPFPEAISFLRNPLGILRPVKHLLHISHMRGYTSLLGHILGSNPEVEGYYELHIGYHSARSLLRQKLLYYKEHKPKRQPSYILDKVLHNEHRTEPAVLQRKNVVTIISIREPGPTVASILKHFRRVSPGHAYCDPDYALKYYCNRITKLAELAESVSGRYAYMDARVLVERPADALNDLSEWLALNTHSLRATT